MRIGLAQARFPQSVADGVANVQRFLNEAYLPGMRESGFPEPDFPPAEQRNRHLP